MNWFTADLHINHNNIIKYCNRPFFNVSEMNNEIINQINKNVKINDVLWILGDVLFSNKKVYLDKINEFLNSLICKNVNLIVGNHDNYKILYDANVFKSLYDIKYINVNNIKIVLCHYKMLVWNESHRGSFHLYGHSHSQYEEWSKIYIPESKSMDVGIDNAFNLLKEYRPFSENEIFDILSKKSGNI